jgi:hypothetical protein
LSKRLIAMLAGVVAIAVVAAGCGSSDNSSESTASLTKAEFIKQGDAICKKGNKEIEEGFESFAKENNLPQGKEPTKAQGRELVETVLVPDIKAQAEGIRALGTPSGDEAEISAMLDSLDEGIEEAEKDPEALFTAKSDPFASANKQAKEYGLKVCGQE